MVTDISFRGSLVFTGPSENDFIQKVVSYLYKICVICIPHSTFWKY